MSLYRSSRPEPTPADHLLAATRAVLDQVDALVVDTLRYLSTAPHRDSRVTDRLLDAYSEMHRRPA